MVLEYMQNVDFVETNTKTNVVVASFCTSYARLKLWGVMNLLGSQACTMIWILLFTLRIQDGGNHPWVNI